MLVKLSRYTIYSVTQRGEVLGLVKRVPCAKRTKEVERPIQCADEYSRNSQTLRKGGEIANFTSRCATDLALKLSLKYNVQKHGHLSNRSLPTHKVTTCL